MSFGHRSDISKSQACFILIDDVSRNFLPHNLVKYSLFRWHCSLSLPLFITLPELTEFEVLESSKSDVFFDVREVPTEVNTLRLTTFVSFQVQANEGRVRWHLCHLISEVGIQISSDQATVSEHQMAGVVL